MNEISYLYCYEVVRYLGSTRAKANFHSFLARQTPLEWPTHGGRKCTSDSLRCGGLISRIGSPNSDERRLRKGIPREKPVRKIQSKPRGLHIFASYLFLFSTNSITLSTSYTSCRQVWLCDRCTLCPQRRNDFYHSLSVRIYTHKGATKIFSPRGVAHRITMLI